MVLHCFSFISNDILLGGSEIWITLGVVTCEPLEAEALSFHLVYDLFLNSEKFP